MIIFLINVLALLFSVAGVCFTIYCLFFLDFDRMLCLVSALKNAKEERQKPIGKPV